MPESRIRRKAAYTAPTPKSGAPKPNPRWFVPVMLGLLVLGLLWVVVYYLFQGEYPIKQLGAWNLVVGFAIMISGFLMTTRWK